MVSRVGAMLTRVNALFFNPLFRRRPLSNRISIVGKQQDLFKVPVASHVTLPVTILL
jgi:hypothetical protein